MSASRRSEWAVRHNLDRIDISIHLADTEPAAVVITGRSEGKRTSLWVDALAPEAPETPAEFFARLGDRIHTLGVVRPHDRLALDDLNNYGTLLNVEENRLFD